MHTPHDVYSNLPTSRTNFCVLLSSLLTFFRTKLCQPYPPLASLEPAILDKLLRPYNIHVLECASDNTDVLATLSLHPSETISAATDKAKGQVTKWLRESLRLAQPTRLLSKGYFACTIGKTTTKAVEQYLDEQGRHHGYAQRLLPPVYVDQYKLGTEDLVRISPKHSTVVAQFHVVLATSHRCGIFGSQQGRVIAREWHELQQHSRFALLKVSFVPDHVHIAFRAHPAESPAEIVTSLMNSAQSVVSEALISARC